MKQQHTLYVSDLDGTLLNEQSQITPHTAQCLNALIDDGMLFTVATARTPATVVELMKDIRLSLPVILMTGALVYDIATHRYLSIRSFPNEVSSRILETVRSTGLAPMVYYIDNSLLHVAYCPPLLPCQQAFVGERRGTPYKRFVECSSVPADRPDTVLIFFMGEYDKMQLVYDVIAPIEGHCSYLYHDNVDKNIGYLEIYPAGTSKASAVEQMAHHLEASQIVAFGDNLNDLPMFEIAHRSYATANAVEALKQQATDIIGANSEDGVARFLSREWEK